MSEELEQSGREDLKRKLASGEISLDEYTEHLVRNLVQVIQLFWFFLFLFQSSVPVLIDITLFSFDTHLFFFLIMGLCSVL